MFKTNFLRLCADKGESPSFVCKKIGISPAAFSQWTDETIPRKNTQIKIADYFNITVDELLAESMTEDSEADALKRQLINIINSETDLDRLEMIDKLIEATAEKRRKEGD